MGASYAQIAAVILLACLVAVVIDTFVVCRRGARLRDRGDDQ